MVLFREQDITIPIILFITSFFFIFCISVPALQINDEWITTNQLHQLSIGHQVLTTEGKYGTDISGESAYFRYHKNILGYSLIFPIVSLLPLFLLLSLGNDFRLYLLIFWSIIPIFLGLLIHRYYPEYSKIRSIPAIFIAAMVSLILLLINLPYYYPFDSSPSIAPIETAAIILTSHLLFSGICVIIYLIAHIVFFNTKKAIIGTISIISCSSLLYWGTSAKDHILAIFLLSVIMYLFIIQIKKERWWPSALGFFITGFLTWTRPEFGFMIFFTLLVFFFYLWRVYSFNNHYTIKKSLILLCIPLFVIPGLTPFFANNIYLTGNPLHPPFLDMGGSENLTRDMKISNTEISPVIEQKTTFQPQRTFLVIFRYFTPNNNTTISDLISVFLFPDRGEIMGLLPLTPLMLFGILLLPCLLFNSALSPDDKTILYLCICLIVGIFLAYARNLQGLHMSEGIGPDIRYYSSMYIPGGLIGLVAMKYFYPSLVKISLKKFIPLIFIIAPGLILLLLITQPFGGGLMQFNLVLSVLSLTLGICLFIQVLFFQAKKWANQTIPVTLLFMICIPLAWQIILIFLFSLAKFDGYSYWVPMSEQIFTHFIVPVG